MWGAAELSEAALKQRSAEELLRVGSDSRPTISIESFACILIVVPPFIHPSCISFATRGLSLITTTHSPSGSECILGGSGWFASIGPPTTLYYIHMSYNIGYMVI